MIQGQRRCLLESFFSGLVILLYVLSRYAAEPLFVVSCLFPVFYLFLSAILLSFGAQGKLIAANKKAKRFKKNGVVSGETRDLFFKRCFGSSFLKYPFYAFAEGEITAFEFRERALEKVKDKKALCLGVYIGLSAALSILVFLSFYFITPFSETLLRLFLSAFFSLFNGAILFFLLYGYEERARKAADSLARVLDGSLLRVKKERDSFDLPTLSGKDAFFRDREPNSDGGAEALRAMIRELDRENI